MRPPSPPAATAAAKSPLHVIASFRGREVGVTSEIAGARVREGAGVHVETNKQLNTFYAVPHQVESGPSLVRASEEWRSL